MLHLDATEDDILWENNIKYQCLGFESDSKKTDSKCEEVGGTLHLILFYLFIQFYIHKGVICD